MSTKHKNSSSDDDATPAAAALLNPPPQSWSADGGGGQSPTPYRMRVTRSSLKLHPNQDPPPPEGGGDTNPPPPDEQNFTQSNGLLTPSSLSHEGADPTDFIPISAAGGLRTTPPHEAILRSTVPSPTITTNSFEALASPDSPPPAQTQVYARPMIPAPRVP